MEQYFFIYTCGIGAAMFYINIMRDQETTKTKILSSLIVSIFWPIALIYAMAKAWGNIPDN